MHKKTDGRKARGKLVQTGDNTRWKEAQSDGGKHPDVHRGQHGAVVSLLDDTEGSTRMSTECSTAQCGKMSSHNYS